MLLFMVAKNRLEPSLTSEADALGRSGTLVHPVTEAHNTIVRDRVQPVYQLTELRDATVDVSDDDGSHNASYAERPLEV
jgi:hypothetical protein